MKAATSILPCLALLALAASGSAIAFETVVIDPGHGGFDEGTEWRQSTEKVLTLEVAQRLEKILRAQGVHSVLTRHTDAFVSLDERSDIANRHPGSLLVSIHFNGSWSSDIRGFEVYAFRESPSGQTVADSIRQSLHTSLLTRDRGLHTNQDYAVLVRTAGPAVLVECGFISNKAEAARLSSPEGMDKLARALAEGIIRVKPLINFDPEASDLAKCEIFYRRHAETMHKIELTERQEKARATQKVGTSTDKRRNGSGNGNGAGSKKKT